MKSGVVAQRTNRGKRSRPVILSNELRKPNGVPCINNSGQKTAVADVTTIVMKHDSRCAQPHLSMTGEQESIL